MIFVLLLTSLLGTTNALAGDRRCIQQGPDCMEDSTYTDKQLQKIFHDVKLRHMEDPSICLRGKIIMGVYVNPPMECYDKPSIQLPYIKSAVFVAKNGNYKAETIVNALDKLSNEAFWSLFYLYQTSETAESFEDLIDKFPQHKNIKAFKMNLEEISKTH